MEPHDAAPSDGAEERIVRHTGAYGLPRREDAVLASSKFRQVLHRSSQRSGQEKPRKPRKILPSFGSSRGKLEGGGGQRAGYPSGHGESGGFTGRVRGGCDALRA